MTFVEYTAAERGYPFAMLWTSPATTAFYSSLGYAVIKAPPKQTTVDTSQIEAMLFARTGESVIYMKKKLLDRCGRTRCVVDLDNLEKKEKVLAVKKCPWERQVGPSCGLFALRTAAEILGGRVDCDLLRHARLMGFSAHGEIFDASHIVQLAAFLGLKARMVFDGDEDWRDVLPSWFRHPQGKLAIFAYDQGKAHAPALRSGRSAHYALVLGYVPSTTELVVVHGLSRMPLLAPLDDFIASNAQLIQINEASDSQDEDNLFPWSSWVIPSNGKPLLARRLVLLEQCP